MVVKKRAYVHIRTFYPPLTVGIFESGRKKEPITHEADIRVNIKTDPRAYKAKDQIWF